MNENPYSNSFQLKYLITLPRTLKIILIGIKECTKKSNVVSLQRSSSTAAAYVQAFLDTVLAPVLSEGSSHDLLQACRGLDGSQDGLVGGLHGSHRGLVCRIQQRRPVMTFCWSHQGLKKGHL